MKSFSIIALVSLALVGAGFAQSPVGPGSVKLGKVSPSVVKTPEYQIVGGENKRFRNREWLELEVEYATQPEEIDELTFKYTVLLEGNHLLDGEVTYVNIPKDREHYAVMYIPPRALEKITGGKPLSPASIVNVWVEVTHSGQALDKPASFKPSPALNAINLPHTTGLILTKDQTPFAPLYYDRYEAQKPSTR
jgi:hypothetical protein